MNVVESRQDARPAGYTFPPAGLLRSFRLEPDPSGQGENPAPAGPPAPGQNPGTPPAAPAAEDMIPRAEAKKAFSERDNAKKAAKAAQAQSQLLASRLGIDPSDLQLVETGNPDNPFELKGEPLEELTRTLSTAREQKLADQKKRGQWEEREKELQTAYQRQMAKAAEEHKTTLAKLNEEGTKQSKAYESYIRKQAAITPIQAACAAEGVIDQDGSGSYTDVVKLVADRVRAETSVDDNGELKVTVVVLNEDGTPMLKPGTAEPADARQLISEFVRQRPYLKRANFRSGPGAGGAGNGSAALATAGKKLTREQSAKLAAAQMFGRYPQI